MSKAISAFIADYQIGHNSDPGETYFSLNGTYFGKNSLDVTGGFGNSGRQSTRSAFYVKKTFEDNSVLRVGEGTSNQHTKFNNANLLGFKYSTSYFNEQNSDVSLYAPILPIQGYSVNPSSMDLFINDRLYQTYDLGVGNYNLQLPLTTALGTGVFKTVIKDKFGNPQILEIPFFTHKELIKSGKWEYELGVGSLQSNSSSYSRKYSGKDYAVDAIVKYGITDDMSTSLFLQDTRDGSMGEARLDMTAPYLPGLLSFGYAHNSKKQGLGSIGFQSKKANSNFNYSVNYEFATKEQFCQNFMNSCTNNRLSSFLSYNSPKGWGNFSFGFAKSKTNNKDLETTSLSWNKQLSRKMHLHSGVYKSKGVNNGIHSQGIQANIALTINWDGGISSGHNYSKNEGSASQWSNSLYFMEDNKNPLIGFGGIQTSTKNGKTEGGIQYQNNSLPFAYYNAFINNTGQKTSINQSLSGSIYYIPEKEYYGLTKSSEGGITLVEIENGIKGIHVLQSNRYSNATNSKGIAVITGTKPSSYNSVSLDIDTIPFNRPVDKLQKDFISPRSGASIIKFKMTLEPFEINLKGVGEKALLYINDEYYMIDDKGFVTLGFEGSAKIERSDGSICELEITKDKKEYVCW